MSTVSEITEALKNALTVVPGLRVYDYLPDQINPPVAYVGIETIDYHGAFSGGNPVHSYTVTVIIGRTSDRTTQRSIDDFLSYDSDRSIRAAIEADRTLDGIVQTCIVTRGGNLASVNAGDVQYVTIDFSVTVYP
jgi:hypothetical protein